MGGMAGALYRRVRGIIESARASAARSVNTAQVVSNWLVGREIVEEEQAGKLRAGYGERLMRDLAARLGKEFGAGYGLANIKLFRQFYSAYPGLVGLPKGCAVRSLLKDTGPACVVSAGYNMPHHGTWRPGRLNSNLCWTHYRTLLRLDRREVRAFYEIEAVNNNWAARELERQINSLLYERLAVSREPRTALRGGQPDARADPLRRQERRRGPVHAGR